MNVRPLILLTLLAGTGIAGYVYFKRQRDLLMQYQIKPIAAKIVQASASSIVVDFTVRLTNVSSVEGEIKTLYADIYINQALVGNVETQGSWIIPAKGQSDISARLSIVPKEGLKNLVSLAGSLLTSGDIQYRMKGYAKMKSSFVSISVPFDETGSLKKQLLGS